MAKPQGMRFDHISLLLSNIEEGIRFFHKILGFPLLTDLRDEEKEVAVVRAGRIHLELWQRDRCSPENRVSVDKRPVFLNHLAFEVRELDSFIQEVRDAGYEVTHEIHVPTDGVREAEISGPDGIQIRFIEQNLSKLVWRTVSGGLKREPQEEDPDEEADNTDQADNEAK